MKIEIKCRFSGSVLFAHEQEDNTVKMTVEAAVKARANLDGANLACANLARAYLAGANLADANLAGANLARAYLDGANLAGAYLDGAYLADAYLAGANLARANLVGAYLADAYLDGAYLAGANLAGANLACANLARAYLDGAYLADAYLADENKLVGKRPIFQIGPIGSRSAYFVAYLTSSGLVLKTGCFTGSVAEFREKLAEEHGDNLHAKEYEAALTLIEKHAELWPAEEETEEAK